MKIRFLCVGGLKKAFFREGVEEYTARIMRYAPFEMVEVREVRSTKKTPREVVMKKEAEGLLARTGPRDFIIALDERGTRLDTPAFAERLERLTSAGGSADVVFVVGGAWGLDASVTGRADLVLRLSDMTLPHELARLVLAEQVYRAFTIMRGEPYSH